VFDALSFNCCCVPSVDVAEANTLRDAVEVDTPEANASNPERYQQAKCKINVWTQLDIERMPTRTSFGWITDWFFIRLVMVCRNRDMPRITTVIIKFERSHT